MSKLITGSGGGKDGGGGASEAPNSLRSTAIARVLDVVSEGEIEGLSTGDGRSIFINGTPAQNPDLSFNFEGMAFDTRVGLPAQSYMPGFPDVEAEGTVGIAVTVAGGSVLQSTDADTDAMRVTMRLTQGLIEQSTENGDINGTFVEFIIAAGPVGGPYTQAFNPTIRGKTNSPYEADYRVERPVSAPTGIWEVQVTRVTADNAASNLKNDTQWARKTLIQDTKEAYNDTAYIGIALDAKSVGNNVPKRQFLVKGIKVKIPSNYNPITRVYSGVWNGTFITAWTDNPAWVIYDLLTNTRYGMGDFIDTSIIDKFTFYDASVYNDGLVDDGTGGTEPRYVFNYQFTTQQTAWQMVQAVASTCRAFVMPLPSSIRLIQDRPDTAVQRIHTSEIINGFVSRTGTSLEQRTTSANVTFNDEDNRYLPRTITFNDPVAELRFGINSIDKVAFGYVKESYAIRYGRWTLYTELNQTEVITFNVPLMYANMQIGDLFELADDDYSQFVGGGYIETGSNSNTIELDREVTIAAGSYTLAYLLSDGITYEERTVTNTPGTYTSLTVSASFSEVPSAGLSWQLDDGDNIETLKLLGISESAPNEYQITAAIHDPDKYAYADNTGTVGAPVYAYIDARKAQEPATNLVFAEESRSNRGDVTNTTRRMLRASWDIPADVSQLSHYRIMWRKDDAEFIVVPEVLTNEYLIDDAQFGIYEMFVYAVNVSGVLSPALSASHTISTTGGSSLLAPANLQVKGGGTTFADPDLEVEWDEVDDITQGDVVAGYEITYKTNGGATTRIHQVIDGDLDDIYPFAQNVLDNSGAPDRDVDVEVRTIDMFGRLSAAALLSASNPAPPAPTISVAAAVSDFWVDVTSLPPSDSDFTGYVFCISTTNGFTPAPADIFGTGNVSSMINRDVLPGTVYYVKVASTDTFGYSSLSDLNFSSQDSDQLAASSTLVYSFAVDGIKFTPAGNVLSWTAGTITVDDGSTSTSYSIASGSTTWTGTKLYIYYSDGNTSLSVSTNPLTAQSSGTNKILAIYNGGNLTQSQDGAFFTDGSDIFASTVAATQMAASSITVGNAALANAVVVNAKIGTAAVSTAKIQNLAVSAAKIGNLQVTNGKIGNLQVTAAKIANANVTTAKIATANVTTLLIGRDQVTVPAGAYVAGATYLANGGWREISRSGFNATQVNGIKPKVILIWEFQNLVRVRKQLRATAYDLVAYTRLLRNGAEIVRFNHLRGGVFIDTNPANGWNTYTIQLYMYQQGNYVIDSTAINQRSLVVFGAKR